MKSQSAEWRSDHTWRIIRIRNVNYENNIGFRRPIMKPEHTLSRRRRAVPWKSTPPPAHGTVGVAYFDAFFRGTWNAWPDRRALGTLEGAILKAMERLERPWNGSIVHGTVGNNDVHFHNFETNSYRLRSGSAI